MRQNHSSRQIERQTYQKRTIHRQKPKTRRKQMTFSTPGPKEDPPRRRSKRLSKDNEQEDGTPTKEIAIERVILAGGFAGNKHVQAALENSGMRIAKGTSAQDSRSWADRDCTYFTRKSCCYENCATLGGHSCHQKEQSHAKRASLVKARGEAVWAAAGAGPVPLLTLGIPMVRKSTQYIIGSVG